jgi:hypothetical protein
MVTKEEYLKALEIVNSYNKQLDESNIKNLRDELVPDLKRNDYVEYIGGSHSKYLTIGTMYRLTSEPFRDKVSIINDNDSRMVVKIKYFKEFQLFLSIRKQYLLL